MGVVSKRSQRGTILLIRRWWRVLGFHRGHRLLQLGSDARVDYELAVLLGG